MCQDCMVSKLGNRNRCSRVWPGLSSPCKGEPVVLLLERLPLVSNSFLAGATSAHLPQQNCSARTMMESETGEDDEQEEEADAKAEDQGGGWGGAVGEG